MDPQGKKSYLVGLFFGAASFTIWGLLPLYWKLVASLTPYQIFSHRVVWSLLFITLILLLQKELKGFFPC